MNYSERYFFLDRTVTCNFIKVCRIIPLLGIWGLAPFHCVNPQLEENTQETTGMFSVNFNRNPTGKWSYQLSLFSTRLGWTLEQVARRGCRSPITLEVLKIQPDKALSNLSYPWSWPCFKHLLEGSFQPKLFCDFHKINTLATKFGKLEHLNVEYNSEMLKTCLVV